MEQLLLSRKKRQVLHNVYCPTVEKTIATCEVALKQLQNEHINYLEVPFDQFDEVQAHFQNNHYIKKGAFTYLQVRHIAQAGNIHHLQIDERGNITFSEESISMSAAISFAQSKWNGAERKQAVENAVLTGLAVIGEEFAEEVIEHQIQLVNIAEHIELGGGVADAFKKNGAKVVVKKLASGTTKKAIYSSVATKKAMTVFNTNVVTGDIVTGSMSSVDIVRTIKGEMSPVKLFKNISKTAASMAGSIIGLMIGGWIGLSIPHVSTAIISLICGIIGLILGSVVTSKIMKKILDFIIKDDVVKMLDIFNTELAKFTEHYMLNEQELHQVLHDFNEIYNMPEELRNMNTANDREVFAKELIEGELDRIVRMRMYLQVPTNHELYETLERIA